MENQIVRKQNEESAFTTILFSVLGQSPAVLTETVWALAHDSTLPVVPDQIVVITTRQGRRAIKRELFDRPVWNTLLQDIAKDGISINNRLKFGISSYHVRLIPSLDGQSDLDDIITTEDAHSTSDFILQALRSFTEHPLTCVIASVAGGRKTMGVLLSNCMVLLGRPHDRLCHVLVQQPYDRPDLCPLFYYPGQVQYHDHSSSKKRFKSRDASIFLSDIPFVRIKNIDWSTQAPPVNYQEMVDRTQITIDDATLPIVHIQIDTGTFFVGSIPVHLSPLEFAVMLTILSLAQRNVHLRSWNIIEEPLRKLYTSKSIPKNYDWWHSFQEQKFPDMKEDIRKCVSRFRRKLTVSGVPPSVVKRLMPSIRDRIDSYPTDKLTISGDLSDVT